MRNGLCGCGHGTETRTVSLGIICHVDLQSLQIDRSAAAKSPRRRRGSPWPFRLGLLAVLGGLAWLFLPSLSQFADQVRLPAVQTVVISAPAPAAAAATSGTAANGYVVAARRAALSSDVPGRIVELLVKEGSIVKKGDVVARLYSDEFAAALARAKAEHTVAASSVERAEAARKAADAEEKQAHETVESQQQLLREAEAQAAFTDAEKKRAEDLLSQGIGSPRDVERTVSESSMARARIHSLEAVLRRAQSATTTAQLRVQVAHADQKVAGAQLLAADAAMQQAQAALDKTNVKAPFDGIVVLKDAEVGEVVSPNVQGGSNARGAVCTMVDFASLEVQANVPETALASVKLGGPCAVFLDAEPDRKLTGKVDRIWPTADRQKATVEVRVQLLETSPALRPEMGVRIVFLAETQPQAETPNGSKAPAVLLVPENALVESGGSITVFVVERDLVRAQNVRIGERKSGRAAVENGLRAGQRIVIDPPASLRDGDRIRLAAR